MSGCRSAGGIAGGHGIGQTSRMKKPIAIALALLLAGCGFHLRNPLTLPADVGPLRVVSPDPYSPLAESLAQALARAGAATPGEEAGAGVATLEIISEQWANTPISLDHLGRAQEFSLRYATVFALRGADGEDVIPQQTVELSRDYVAPPTDAIGKNSERELLSSELRRDMAAAILRRVDVVARARF